jgi:hypothetical protein
MQIEAIICSIKHWIGFIKGGLLASEINKVCFERIAYLLRKACQISDTSLREVISVFFMGEVFE